MSLRTRLALGIFAIALVLIIPLLLSLRSLERLHKQTLELRDGEFAASMVLSRMRSAVDDMRRAEMALLFVRDDASRVAFETEVERMTSLADTLNRYGLDSAAQQTRRATRQAGTNAADALRAVQAARPAVAESISANHVVPAMNRIAGAIAEGERTLSARTHQRVDLAASATEDAWQMSVLALLLAMGLAGAIGIWLTRSIARPVRDLERGMHAVAEGDFSHDLTITQDRQDEFGRLAESYRAMAMQLAQLDRMKAEFVSVASHELKTPINVIIGYLQLFDEGIYGELSPKQREICRTIDAQAHTLSRLVQQLLDISRFEAGAGNIEPRELNLATFVDDLERTFHVLALQREITFEVQRAEDLPETVSWDPDRMNEVLGNLLSNAFKFTDRGGRVVLAIDSPDHAVRMEVRDTGAGIPPSQLPHIFRKFYQADNQARAAQLGTGLGLAISKEIVDGHGGSISCESTPGVGTTFALTLPIRATVQRPAVEAALPETTPT